MLDDITAAQGGCADRVGQLTRDLKRGVAVVNLLPRMATWLATCGTGNHVPHRMVPPLRVDPPLTPVIRNCI
jgi:hypothetical protein